MSKLKVLLVYIVYPLAMGTYFRSALEHREDVDLRVAGIYTGSWIPWKGGMSLPIKYAKPPDYVLPLSLGSNEYNYEMIMAQIGDWKPDLVIQVDAGFHAKYKPSQGVVVTVGTDPHVLNDFYDVPRQYSDFFFNMQNVYSKPKDIYLPYAYSKYDFYPEDVEPSEMVDAVMIGMPYEQRVQWVDILRSKGVKVIFENGPILEDARHLYACGKIGLNWSSLDDLNCRAFELPAMKLAPVMNRVTDISKFFKEGTDFMGFSSLGEAVEQVLYLVENPEFRLNMAEQAYQRVLSGHHTYDDRIDQILKVVGS